MGTLNELLGTLDADAGVRYRQFEHICKWFLENDPIYKRELRRVWLWDRWPGRWGADAGIDIVAEKYDGRLWAIQVKAYDPAHSVTKADVDTFLSESARSEFSFRLLIATTDRIGRIAERTLLAQEKPASRLLLGDLRAAQAPWPRSPSDLEPVRTTPKRPRPHQRQAITGVVRGFKTASRGQMIMACGTGKTLTALFIAQHLSAKRTLVLVPSLSLLADTLREWTANATEFDFLPVCSDDTVTGADDAVSTTVELGFPTTTDPTEIAAFLRRNTESQVVFATYQSSPRIAEAFRLGRVPGFDLVIADEAHRCAGRVSSDFATVLDPDAIPSRRRLFMTATPRFFTGRVVKEAKESNFEVASMDDESCFGPVFHRLGFAKAIEDGLLTDYQVVVVGVDDATYFEWAERGRYVTTDNTTETDARTLAAQIGLAKAMKRYDLRRTISFHSRVSGARDFASSMSRLVEWMPASERPTGKLWSTYVSGKMSAGQRSILLDHLRHLDDQERGLLANVRCLGEGIDVPALDGVAFIDPRRSEVDIIQAVGRSIRLAEDKKIGTIVIPVFIEAGDDPDAALDASEFKPVWDVIRALRAHDNGLGEDLDELRRELGRGENRRQSPPDSRIHLLLPERIGSDFVDAFEVRLVEQTTESWEFWLGLLQRFVAREGHTVVPNGLVEDGYKLGRWVQMQRMRRQLGADRETRLEALPGWTWDPSTDKWEEGFRQLLRFVGREGHSLVPRPFEQDGYRLAQWVSVQRTFYRRGQLGADRAARLEALPGWSWNSLVEKWEEGFRELQHFVATEGHSLIPLSHVDDGYKLGRWVQKQRADYAMERLLLDRVNRLEAVVGWIWDPLADRWDEAFGLLCGYTERKGHSVVPLSYVEDGLQLGWWVQMQRIRKQLGADRVNRLEALPDWTWDPAPEKWEEGFRHLQRFAGREGHCLVPSRYVESDYRLGHWTSTQRSTYARGQLGAGRETRLESLPGWTWDPLADRWEEAFDLLYRYTEREGHAFVPLVHVENGYKLGRWVQKQRADNATERLLLDRVSRLEALPGWGWGTPRGSKSASSSESG